MGIQNMSKHKPNDKQVIPEMKR